MEPLKAFLEKHKANLEQKVPIDLLTATRNDLAVLFGEMNLTVGVELGVESGKFSETLLSSNPALRLTSIDGWTAYRGYRDHVSQSKMDGFYADAKERLKKFGDRTTLMKNYSMDAVKKFAPGQLDFVYLDGNHSFDYVMQDIIEWSKRVRSGGIVAGHDFIRRLNEPVHVIQATQVYTYCHWISPWFTVGGATKETRSFFWVKP